MMGLRAWWRSLWPEMPGLYKPPYPEPWRNPGADALDDINRLGMTVGPMTEGVTMVGSGGATLGKPRTVFETDLVKVTDEPSKIGDWRDVVRRLDVERAAEIRRAAAASKRTEVDNGVDVATGERAGYGWGDDKPPPGPVDISNYARKRPPDPDGFDHGRDSAHSLMREFLRGYQIGWSAGVKHEREHGK